MTLQFHAARIQPKYPMREYINLCENFLNAFHSDGEYVEVYVDPSMKEFSAVYAANHEGARGFLDTEQEPPCLYVWDAAIATHEDADVGLGIWGQRCEWLSPDTMTLYWNYRDDHGPQFTNFAEVREWVLGLDLMKRIGLKTVLKA